MKERVADDVCLLPLYHFGEPKDALLRILNTPVNGKLPDYIGVGGRHGVSTAQQDSYFNEIFALVQKSDNPNVKIHAFGMTVLKLLEKYPFYMFLILYFLNLYLFLQYLYSFYSD